MTRKRLIDVFPEWATGSGIFSALQEFDVPWKNESISGSLDLEYFGNISGEKFCSPLVNKIISGDVLTTAEKTLLATAIFVLNNVNWSKQWETLSFEYDPIQNYSMKEKMEDDETVIEYGRVHDKTGTETETPTVVNTVNSSLYGFNSSDDVPTGKQVSTPSGDNEISYNQTDADSGEDTHTRNYELTRSGNIGVTTSQQMIESERNLWLWNFFYSVVFPDIDRALTLKIY